MSIKVEYKATNKKFPSANIQNFQQLVEKVKSKYTGLPEDFKFQYSREGSSYDITDDASFLAFRSQHSAGKIQIIPLEKNSTAVDEAINSSVLTEPRDEVQSSSMSVKDPLPAERKQSVESKQDFPIEMPVKVEQERQNEMIQQSNSQLSSNKPSQSPQLIQQLQRVLERLNQSNIIKKQIPQPLKKPQTQIKKTKLPFKQAVPKPNYAIHYQIPCSLCRIKQIFGTRWKSIKKFDYDLCDDCYSQIKNKDDFISLQNESQLASLNFLPAIYSLFDPSYKPQDDDTLKPWIKPININLQDTITVSEIWKASQNLILKMAEDEEDDY